MKQTKLENERKRKKKKKINIKKVNLQVEIEKKKFEEERQRDFFKNKFKGRNIFGNNLKENKKKLNVKICPIKGHESEGGGNIEILV